MAGQCRIAGSAIVALACALALSACNSPRQKIVQSGPKAEISNKTQFSVADYGVPASPRITELAKVPVGGGRYSVGKPYKVKGKWYRPRENPSYAATGVASWYGPNFHGRLTANGEIYNQYALSAAHPTLPLPSYVRVTNLENDRSVMVRVNDRGPYAHGRLIDLSARAAKMLDFTRKGVAKVRVEYAGKARLDGKDEQFLLASYRGPDALAPGASQPGTLIAMAEESGETASLNVAAPLTAEGGQAFASLEPPLVPVPLRRPGDAAIFEGLPLGIAEGAPLVVAGLAPLGFAAEQVASDRMLAAFRRFDTVSAFAARDIDERAREAAVVEIGAFAALAGAHQASAAFSATGLVEIFRDADDGRYRVRMLVGGDVTERILADAHRMGFADARVLTD
jgi:rare lipoprotein A